MPLCNLPIPYVIRNSPRSGACSLYQRSFWSRIFSRQDPNRKRKNTPKLTSWSNACKRTYDRCFHQKPNHVMNNRLGISYHTSISLYKKGRYYVDNDTAHHTWTFERSDFTYSKHFHTFSTLDNFKPSTLKRQIDRRNRLYHQKLAVIPVEKRRYVYPRLLSKERPMYFKPIHHLKPFYYQRLHTRNLELFPFPCTPPKPQLPPKPVIKKEHLKTLVDWSPFPPADTFSDQRYKNLEPFFPEKPLYSPSGKTYYAPGSNEWCKYMIKSQKKHTNLLWQQGAQEHQEQGKFKQLQHKLQVDEERKARLNDIALTAATFGLLPTQVAHYQDRINHLTDYQFKIHQFFSVRFWASVSAPKLTLFDSCLKKLSKDTKAADAYSRLVTSSFSLKRSRETSIFSLHHNGHPKKIRFDDQGHTKSYSTLADLQRNSLIKF
uniref:DEP domain-containing protein 1A n=1 Tax=Anthurium amnicola TaxID=1678845 RepID=A0A1D1Z3F5_9ARAE